MYSGRRGTPGSDIPEDYPDYRTQGESLEDLREHLKDLHHDIASGQIPGIRKVEELTIS